ncbi:Vacuolar protein sorting-associated protein 55 [Apiotrichum porosum]|uniref:Vacuolar protein sorting-associated protein 55 n=1 Tax=Apiotrichum porosum TaxID=105984 RepID=A0A427Y5D0_9TREE|nr:Vacuolar protein sorting-associated protein 55 [Apiotrichum porosum]RSH86272.1 Vacuolar protein sorting-associated protein 55 [Apiotrichum porosum]
MAAGIKTVIFLAFVLALGFLLVILSCALYQNWLPLIVAFTFVLAPLPNSICARCARADDISPEYNSAYVDFGRFVTGMLVATGFALPLVLLHSGIIYPGACWMAISGGLLVYGTILVYSGWFGSGSDDDEF